MSRERAYWLAIALWVFNCILFIFILIPTPLYISEYKETTEYAQQNSELRNSYIWVSFWTLYDIISNAALLTAIATIAIACFTGTLWWSTRGLLRATNESIQLTREAFIAANRPRLIVRELLLFPITPSRSSAGIRYTIANNGAGRAEIVESHRELVLIKDAVLRPLQPIEGANPVGNVTLEPGEHIFREAESTIGYAEFENAKHRQLYDADNSTKLFFRGFIIYADKNKLRRQMAFCREYKFTARCFRIVDDPDYEYAD
jgi:hypothetical protein